MQSGTPLERKLIERISRDGPLTFRSFMQSALYDPEHGYYNTERLKIGPSGDYYTSSNVHSAFGTVLAGVLAGLLAELGKRSDHHAIVEVGAGTGQLSADILNAIRDEHRAIFDSLSYVIVERSPVMRVRQQEKLADFGDRVQWRKLEDLARFSGVVFSNELVDAMPVHRVRNWRERLEESYLTIHARDSGELVLDREGSPFGELSDSRPGQLTFAWGDASTPGLREYLTRSGVTLADGQVAEIGLDAIDWLAHVSEIIEDGFLVTIDYGDVAELLYGVDRREGTLRSFHKHSLVDSPIERVGEQDLTASVNFTALMEYGRDYGLETVSYERQASFLIRNGLIDRIEAISASTGGVVDDLKERLLVKNLFVPGGVSDNFRVLIQRKRPI